MQHMWNIEGVILKSLCSVNLIIKEIVKYNTLSITNRISECISSDRFIINHAIIPIKLDLIRLYDKFEEISVALNSINEMFIEIEEYLVFIYQSVLNGLKYKGIETMDVRDLFSVKYVFDSYPLVGFNVVAGSVRWEKRNTGYAVPRLTTGLMRYCGYLKHSKSISKVSSISYRCRNKVCSNKFCLLRCSRVGYFTDEATRTIQRTLAVSEVPRCRTCKSKLQEESKCMTVEEQGILSYENKYIRVISESKIRECETLVLGILLRDRKGYEYLYIFGQYDKHIY
ncbi:hypothetical protein PAEPH01_1979, partial [Pancytospora epiphaga]